MSNDQLVIERSKSLLMNIFIIGKKFFSMRILATVLTKRILTYRMTLFFSRTHHDAKKLLTPIVIAAAAADVIVDSCLVFTTITINQLYRE